MTTPRVTVPVERLELASRLLDQGRLQAASHLVQEMLSAAPAPEGGAVSRDQVLAIVRQFTSPSWCSVDRLVDTLFAALATREEAPAEAGERECGWCDGRKTKQTSSTDFTIPCPYCKGTGKEALRAQPPAREDAQPFGYWVTHPVGENPVFIRYGSFVPADDRYTVQPLYTHPAPDALRVAAEALEKTRDRIQEWPIDDHETCMCGSTIEAHDIGSGHSPVSQANHAISIIVEEINQALAALQAEQGAK